MPSQTPTTEPQFLIWSEEHGAWWRADSSGYSKSIFDAGKFSFKEAARIVFEANRYSDEVKEVALFAILLNP